MPPTYSILGLGDIVIPGIFMSMCLRYDFIRTLDLSKYSMIADKERKGEVETNSFIKYLVDSYNAASKHYYISVVIGYLIAIITTIVIMLLFNHGQPALLYLVPGCLFSVFICASVKGEFSKLWEFNEEVLL